MEEVANVDKPMVYYDAAIERFVYRASALMSCQNALILARMGVDGARPPEKMQKRFNEGHRQEALILDAIEADMGFSPYAQQQELGIEIGTKALIRGHVDALSQLSPDVMVHSFDGFDFGQAVTLASVAANLGRSIDWDRHIAVVDAKAFAPSTMQEWTRKQFESSLGLHYLWQQATYLYAGDFNAIVMACKDKVSGDVRVDLFTADWVKARLPKSTIFQRVMWCERAANENKLFDLPCSPKMYPCPYYMLHPDAVAEQGNTHVGDAELHRLGQARLDAQAAVEAAKAQLDLVEADILNHVGNEPMKGVKYGDFTIGTSYGSHSVVQWGEIAQTLGITIEQAKERFQRSQKNNKLSIRITKPKS